jgi:hypothetical protein
LREAGLLAQLSYAGMSFSMPLAVGGSNAGPLEVSSKSGAKAATFQARNFSTAALIA